FFLSLSLHELTETVNSTTPSKIPNFLNFNIIIFIYYSRYYYFLPVTCVIPSGSRLQRGAAYF
ncbi:MAG: hypothetical protein ACI9WT_000555, partial [Flavobacterium sp.]